MAWAEKLEICVRGPRKLEKISLIVVQLFSCRITVLYKQKRLSCNTFNDPFALKEMQQPPFQSGHLNQTHNLWFLLGFFVLNHQAKPEIPAYLCCIL